MFLKIFKSILSFAFWGVIEVNWLYLLHPIRAWADAQGHLEPFSRHIESFGQYYGEIFPYIAWLITVLLWTLVALFIISCYVVSLKMIWKEEK